MTVLLAGLLVVPDSNARAGHGGGHGGGGHGGGGHGWRVRVSAPRGGFTPPRMPHINTPARTGTAQTMVTRIARTRRPAMPRSSQSCQNHANKGQKLATNTSAPCAQHRVVGHRLRPGHRHRQASQLGRLGYKPGNPGRSWHNHLGRHPNQSFLRLWKSLYVRLWFRRPSLPGLRLWLRLPKRLLRKALTATVGRRARV